MSTNYIDQITDTAGTTHDISEGDSTRIFRATCSTAASTAAKVATLDTSNRNFSLASGVRVAVTFTYGNTATTPTLRVDGSSTGTAKNMAVWSDNSSVMTGGGATYFYWGPYETIIFTYDGTRWIIGQGGAIYKAYALANSKTSNTGTVTQVTAGTGLSIGTTAGGNFTTSGTINHTNSVTAQTTQAVYPIKIDAQGHISAYGSAVTSMPASDVSSWAKASSKPSYTASEVGAAASSHAHGNITSGGDITATAPTIASGDQLIINDDSASKVTNGPTFDGSTTTKALSQKGTWETFSNSLLYGECSTAAATVAKTVTVNSSFKLVTGATIAVKFSNTNTADAPTLNVNSTGAKALKRTNSTYAGTSSHTSWVAGETVPLLYDGSSWLIMNNMAQNNYVTQSYSSSNTDYNLALSAYTSTNGGATTLNHSNKIKGNPSTGRVTTEDLSDSDIDALINDLDVTGTYGSVEVKKLLWTNPSPTSAFAAQKINLNLADYDVVEIHAYAALGTNYSQIVSSSADIGTTGTFIGIKPVEKASTDTTTIMQRSFEVADDGVTFTGGIYRLYSATTIGTAPDVYIPYKIYGIKNNFNVGSISVVDNVIEQGTSGNWIYRKWNSGLAECWLPSYNPGSYTVGTARGSLYSGGNLPLTYPITFVSYPTVTGSVSLGTDAYVVWLQFNALGTSTAQCRIVSSGSVAANSNYLISVYVTGRWK